MLRRHYGIAAPVLRDLEVADCLGGSGVEGFDFYAGGAGRVHRDVLGGHDWEVGGWEGIYGGEGREWDGLGVAGWEGV